MASTGRFVVLELGRDMFTIGWFEDGEIGGYLGQSERDGKGRAPRERPNWEWWKAARIMLELGATRSDRRFAYVFTEKRVAERALRLIKLAHAQERKPPAWARQALAAGWKPPKGWKP